MRFGLSFVNTGPLCSPDPARRFLRTVEGLGYESVWTGEHVVIPAGFGSRNPYSDGSGALGFPEDYPIADPLAWLAFASGVTSRLVLGTGTLLAPLRNPVLLAKEAASVDRMSAGRLRLGLGIGWLQEEADALGVEWRTRAARTESTVHAMRRLWVDSPATYRDEYASFADVHVRPGPHGKSVPIIITGSSLAAARRAGRLGDGFMPIDTPDLPRLLDTMRTAAAEAGRSIADIEVSLLAREPTLEDPSAVERLAALGVDRVILRFPTFDLRDHDDELGMDSILERLSGLTIVRAPVGEGETR